VLICTFKAAPALFVTPPKLVSVPSTSRLPPKSEGGPKPALTELLMLPSLVRVPTTTIPNWLLTVAPTPLVKAP